MAKNRGRKGSMSRIHVAVICNVFSLKQGSLFIINYKGGFAVKRVEKLVVPLDNFHHELLNSVQEKLCSKGKNMKRADILLKALFNYALNDILDTDSLDKVINKYYKDIC